MKLQQLLAAFTREQASALAFVLLALAAGGLVLLLVPAVISLLLHRKERKLYEVFQPLALPLALLVAAGAGNALVGKFLAAKPWHQPLQLALEILSVLIAGWAVLGLLTRLLLYYESSSQGTRLVRWLRGLLWPIRLGVLTATAYLALVLLVKSQQARHVLDTAATLAFICVLTFGLSRAVQLAFTDYRNRLEGGVQAATVNLLNRLVQLTILLLAALLILDQLGIKVTTLVTSLGIAGLAASLALQDTLSNLFAGIYLAGSHPLKPGDYVKLESGEEGFVVEIGWRHTTLRSWDNLLVVVPNSKVASTTFTNYNLPVPELSARVYCGVSYESDLEKVEQVALEAAREVQQAVTGALREWEPIVLFKEFGDSNINFVTVLRAKSPKDRFQLQHAYIKLLFKRFKEHDISINYPVQRLVTDEPLRIVQEEPGTR